MQVCVNHVLPFVITYGTSREGCKAAGKFIGLTKHCIGLHRPAHPVSNGNSATALGIEALLSGVAQTLPRERSNAVLEMGAEIRGVANPRRIFHNFNAKYWILVQSWIIVGSENGGKCFQQASSWWDFRRIACSHYDYMLFTVTSYVSAATHTITYGQKLEDYPSPILFRPFHEMGSHFSRQGSLGSAQELLQQGLEQRLSRDGTSSILQPS